MSMFTDKTTVHKAQMAVRCALLNRPLDVRATLPFDPDDKQDIRVWVSDRLAKEPCASAKTSAHAVRRLVWDARNKARPRKLHFVNETALGKNGLKGYCDVHSSSVLDKTEIVEELAASSVRAALKELNPDMRQPTCRKGKAILSCLARICYKAKSHLSDDGWAMFFSTLFEHHIYKNFPLPSQVLEEFRVSMQNLRCTGSFRRDLRDADCSCPGNDQWKRFVTVLASEYEDGEFLASYLDTLPNQRRTA